MNNNGRLKIRLDENKLPVVHFCCREMYGAVSDGAIALPTLRSGMSESHSKIALTESNTRYPMSFCLYCGAKIEINLKG